MDADLYKREVNRLSNEIDSMKTDVSENITSSGKTIGILKYKNYFFLTIAAAILLYFIKPKVALKIVSSNNTVSMAIDVRKFILTWFIVSAIGCLVLYIFLNYKKPT